MVNPVRTGASGPDDRGATLPSTTSVLYRRQNRWRSNWVKRILLILLAAAAGGLYFNDYRLSHAECIPIEGSFFRWDDRVRKDNIKQAMSAIREYSPEDYERICTRAKSIQIVRFEDQWIPTVPTDSLGSYSPNPEDPSAKGVINIDRETALSFKSDIEHVLVHEACHAYLIQTVGDYSQEPCFNREHVYLLARPKMPLEERSAEMQKRTGKKFYAYCSSKSEDVVAAKGDCVFINYTTESKNMCAKVFLKNGNKIELEKEICREIEALGYTNPSFELKYLTETHGNIKYQFGFSPLNFE